MTGKLIKGLVQVYTGNGKGKTTAAFGQALRAFGSGLQVCIIQFLKGPSSGEVIVLQKLVPEIQMFCWGNNEFIIGAPSDLDKQRASKGLHMCTEVLREGSIDLIVLDEICTAVSLGVVDEKEVLKLLEEKPSHTEMILTGRNATDGIMAAADLITEMKAIKHPFDSGQKARQGIEY